MLLAASASHKAIEKEFRDSLCILLGRPPELTRQFAPWTLHRDGIEKVSCLVYGPSVCQLTLFRNAFDDRPMRGPAPIHAIPPCRAHSRILILRGLENARHRVDLRRIGAVERYRAAKHLDPGFCGKDVSEQVLEAERLGHERHKIEEEIGAVPEVEIDGLARHAGSIRNVADPDVRAELFATPGGGSSWRPGR